MWTNKEYRKLFANVKIRRVIKEDFDELWWVYYNEQRFSAAAGPLVTVAEGPLKCIRVPEKIALEQFAKLL